LVVSRVDHDSKKNFSKVGVEDLVDSMAIRTGSAEDAIGGLESEFWV